MAGINLTTNFVPNTNNPLDTRIVVADVTARNSLAFTYPGMITYVSSNKSLYFLSGGITSSYWHPLSAIVGHISGGSGTAAWGSISGNINLQLDLMDKLSQNLQSAHDYDKTLSGNLYGLYHADDKSMSGALHSQITATSAANAVSWHADDVSVSGAAHSQVVSTSASNLNTWHQADLNVSGSLYSTLHGQITATSAAQASGWHDADKSLSAAEYSLWHGDDMSTSASIYSTLHDQITSTSASTSLAYHDADKILSGGVYSLYHADDKNVSGTLHSQITAASASNLNTWHQADLNASGYVYSELHSQVTSVSGASSSGWHAADVSLSGQLYSLYHADDKSISGSVYSTLHDQITSTSAANAVSWHQADVAVSGLAHSQTVSTSASNLVSWHADDVSVSGFLHGQIVATSAANAISWHSEDKVLSSGIYSLYHADDKSVSGALHSQITATSSANADSWHAADVSLSGQEYSLWHADDKTASAGVYSTLHSQITSTSAQNAVDWHSADTNVSGFLHSQITSVSAADAAGWHLSDKTLSSGLYDLYHADDKSTSAAIHSQITATSAANAVSWHQADVSLSGQLYSLWHSDDKSVSGSLYSTLHGQITATSASNAVSWHDGDTAVSSALHSQVVSTSASNRVTWHGEVVAASGQAHSQLTSVSASNLSTWHQADLAVSGYSDDQLDLRRQYLSPGVLSLPSFSSNGDGTAAIGACSARMFTQSGYAGDIWEYSVTPTSALAFTDVSQNYVYINYNGGSPVYAVTTSLNDFNNSDKVHVFSVYRSGTTLTHYNSGVEALGLATQLAYRLKLTQKFARATGLSLMGTTGLSLDISEGKLFFGIQEYSHSAYNASSAGATFWIRTSTTTWTSTPVTAPWTLNNSHWDDATGTPNALHNANSYTINWIYKEARTGNVHYALGQADYTLANLVSAVPPDLTNNQFLALECYVAGRVVYNKNSSTPYSVSNSYDTVFASAVGGGAQSYANMRTVATAGGDFTSIQSAINSITDASASNRYTIYIYPGTYSENLTFGAVSGNNYITLRGTSRLNGPIIAGTSGNLVTFHSSLTAGAFGFRDLSFQLNPTASGSSMFYSTGNGFTASVVDCSMTITIATNDVSSSFSSFSGSSTASKFRLQRNLATYSMTGTGVAGITHTLFSAGGLCFSDFQSNDINVTVSENDNVNVISNTSTSTVVCAYDQNHFSVKCTNGSYNKTMNLFCKINSSAEGHIKYSNINAESSSAGTARFLYMSAVSGSSYVNSTANRIQFSGFGSSYLNYVGANCTHSSNFDDIRNSMWADPTNAGTFTYANGPLDGEFRVSDSIRLDSLSGSMAVVTDASDNLVSSTTTATELGYVHGVTSGIQTQLNAKAASTVFTGDTGSGGTSGLVPAPAAGDAAAGKVLGAGGGWVAGGGGSGSKVVQTITASGHGFTAGTVNKPISKLSNGTYALSKGDTAANAEFIGMFTSYVDVDTFTVTTLGDYTWTSHGFTGPAVVVSDVTAGDLMETLPTVGNWCAIAAIVKDSNTLTVVNRSPYQVFPAAGAAAYVHTFTSSDLLSGQLTLVHNLGVQVVPVTVADNSGNQVFPKNILFSNANQCVVDLGTVVTVTGTWTATIFMATGGLLTNNTCTGRLTLTSGSPVMTADALAATTVYFTPHNGNQIDLYNGTFWNRYQFSELSLSIAGYTASTLYDVFVYNNSGVLTLSSTAWSNSGAGTSTRATALVYQNGVLVKSGATTYRYLGTIMTTSTTGQTEVSFGQTAAVGGSAPKCLLWNAYNKVQGQFSILNSTYTYTYTTGTWRQMANSANSQFSFAVGLAGESSLNATNTIISSNTTNASRLTSWGINSTSTPQNPNTQNNTNGQSMTTQMIYSPALGYNFLAPLEYSVASGTSTWWGVPYGCSNLDFWY